MDKILKLIPTYKDYIWGGNTLKSKYGKDTSTTPLAESWELSVHPDGLSVISNGEYKGKTLKEYLNDNKDALGTKNASGELPILIKFIDAEDNLSIQVHPNDIQAKEWENQNGKTEVWYVVDSKKDAQIIYGMKDNTTKEELTKAINDNSVLELLSSYDAKKGDVFFVEAGTVHAIGKGNLIAEIQQNSNVTYRLYDYDRRDKNGNPRELHIEKGTKASNTKAVSKREMPMLNDNTRLLASCEYFQVKELKLKEEYYLKITKDSYCALLNVDGEAIIENKIFKQGECIFIPAQDDEIKITGDATILITQEKPKYYVGLDIGGTSIKTAVVDEYGVIYGRATAKTLMPRSYNEILDDCIECIRECTVKSGIDFNDIESVGIGCPGAINIDEGIVEFSNNLDMHNVPIRKYIEKRINKPIYLDNDANAAAWGEFLFGSGRGTKSMVLLTLGTGVGGGVVENGRLARGAYDKGAELGHNVICVGGEKCTCGRRGCLETYASATALIRMTKKAMKDNPNCDLWDAVNGKLSNVSGITAFSGKDEISKAVIKRYLSYLSEGVVNIVNMLQPEVVCIGGGISGAGDKIIKPINNMIKNKSFARFSEKQSVAKVATLGNDAGIAGAAMLWMS